MSEQSELTKEQMLNHIHHLEQLCLGIYNDVCQAALLDQSKSLHFRKLDKLLRREGILPQIPA